jgi:hypothetical protein
MLRLLFLSSISATLLASAGCSDDACGPGSAPDNGLVAGDVDNKLTFGGLTSSANNDCPDQSAPAGVVSLTVSGTQTDGTGFITLCIPRPDQLAAGVTLGATGLRIIDLMGQANGCDYKIESTRPVTGTAKATGVCDNGASGGYALTIDGHISLTKTCATSSETLAVNLSGTVAVN